MIIVVHFILFASVLRRVAIKRILTCLANFFMGFVFVFKEMENDVGFQQAVRTSHGRRPPVSVRMCV